MVAVALSLMVEDSFRVATLPLFEAGLIGALEHSFEISWAADPAPAWFDALLDHYSAADRLWGHGVTMSPFSVHAPDRSNWLDRVAADCRARRYVGVSEHYGFMVAGACDGGAPLPLPPGDVVRDVGIASLSRLTEATRVPVGLENLALALSPRDVWTQGPLLHDVLDAVDGYLVLDLHNLWCQCVNFDVDPIALLESYPLARARCIHVAGGSWSEPRAGGERRRFRRDTHDDDVPTAVHALLRDALPRCPALDVIVVERIGGTLRDRDAGARLRDDVERVHTLLQEAGRHG